MKIKTTKETIDSYSSLHDDMSSTEMNKSIMDRAEMTELFENALKDVYWAEKALTKAMPKLIKHSSSRHLIDVLETHLAETLEQAFMLEQVFTIIGKKPAAKRCAAMEGLLNEGDEIIKDTTEGPQRDAGIIAASRKVEHYEIASYSSLCFFARTLHLEDAATILEEILEQEKNADIALAELAIITINVSSLLE